MNSNAPRMCTVSHCREILPGNYEFLRCERHRIQNRHHSKLKRVRDKESKAQALEGWVAAVGAHSHSGMHSSTEEPEDDEDGSLFGDEYTRGVSVDTAFMEQVSLFMQHIRETDRNIIPTARAYLRLREECVERITFARSRSATIFCHQVIHGKCATLVALGTALRDASKRSVTVASTSSLSLQEQCEKRKRVRQERARRTKKTRLGHSQTQDLQTMLC